MLINHLRLAVHLVSHQVRIMRKTLQKSGVPIMPLGTRTGRKLRADYQANRQFDLYILASLTTSPGPSCAWTGLGDRNHTGNGAT